MSFLKEREIFQIYHFYFACFEKCRQLMKLNSHFKCIRSDLHFMKVYIARVRSNRFLKFLDFALSFYSFYIVIFIGYLSGSFKCQDLFKIKISLHSKISFEKSAKLWTCKSLKATKFWSEQRQCTMQQVQLGYNW